MFSVGEFVGFIVPLDEYIYVTSCYVNAIELSLVSVIAQVFNGRNGIAPARCGGGVRTIVTAESSFHRYFSLLFDEDKSNTQVETILIL